METLLKLSDKCSKNCSSSSSKLKAFARFYLIAVNALLIALGIGVLLAISTINYHSRTKYEQLELVESIVDFKFLKSTRLAYILASMAMIILGSIGLAGIVRNNQKTLLAYQILAYVLLLTCMIGLVLFSIESSSIDKQLDERLFMMANKIQEKQKQKSFHGERELNCNRMRNLSEAFSCCSHSTFEKRLDYMASCCGDIESDGCYDKTYSRLVTLSYYFIILPCVTLQIIILVAAVLVIPIDGVSAMCYCCFSVKKKYNKVLLDMFELLP
jgi:hypothetical protein